MKSTMTRDQAIDLIRKTVIPFRGDHSYIGEPGVFEPHEWVVQAVLAAHAHACEEQGDVVVTKTQDGQIIAVTRQDEEGKIMSVISESTPQVPAHKWEQVALGMSVFLRQYKPPLAHADKAQALVAAVDAYSQMNAQVGGPLDADLMGAGPNL